MSARRLERLTFPGPSGRLEGLLQRPDVRQRFASVVSHPHPLHGGTLHEKVTYRVARALEESGATVMRFNFRGAGRSEGVHDGGRGEQDDLRAALAHLRSVTGTDVPVALAGFSFGAVMSAAVGCDDPAVEALLLVGTPVRTWKLTGLDACRKPIAFVHGDRDEHGPVDELRERARRLAAPVTLRVVAGADHFFRDQQDELFAAVRTLGAAGALGHRIARDAGGGANPAVRHGVE